MQARLSVGNALWVSPLSFVEAATPGNAGFIDAPQQRMGIQHPGVLAADGLAHVSAKPGCAGANPSPDGYKAWLGG